MESRTLEKENELLLVEKARGGNVQSFSALVRLYEERAIHLAYSFLGNMEDARDAAQEAFVKAYENLRSFKRHSRFSTWLYRIVINHCKDFLRKKKVRRHVTASAILNEEGEEIDPVENVAAKDPGALRNLVNREIGETIHSALKTLPFQQKSVFAMRYLEGMSLEEIAQTLELSEGAVKAHLWQAGQKMKKSLADYLPERGS